MPLDVFVDESVRRSYVLSAVRVDPRYLAASRAAVRALLLKGERRIHFSKESDRRRRELLTRLCDHGFDVALYCAPAHDHAARANLVALLVDDLGEKLHRLVFESRAAADADDKRKLVELHRAGRLPDHATYEHLRPHEEPLLWVADAVAWSHGAGGDWARRIEPMVSLVRHHKA